MRALRQSVLRAFTVPGNSISFHFGRKFIYIAISLNSKANTKDKDVISYASLEITSCFVSYMHQQNQIQTNGIKNLRSLYNS